MYNVNSKKFCALISISLITLCFVPLCFARIDDQAPSGRVNAPGMPSDAAQFDMTDMTPLRDMERITSRVMHVFAYRNVTLMFNSTRNCELNVTVDSSVKPRVLSLSVEPNQNLSLIMNMSGSPPSGEQVMERTLNFYLGIEPNATVELQAQIRLHINATELNQELNRVINASRLTWMYWNRTSLNWIPVDSIMDQNGYLVCNTTHFSTWTVAETNPAPVASTPSATPTPSESPQPSASTSPTPIQSQSPSPLQSTSAEPESTASTNMPTEYIYIIIIAVVCAVAAITVVSVKKKTK